MGYVITLLLAAALSAAERKPLVNPAKVIDLSYAYDEQTIYWPTSAPFQWRKDAWGISAGGYWYASATFTTSEHGGTHMDSPIHFGEGKMSTAEIPVSRLVGPAAVIDVAAACAANPDYLVTANDVQAWEKRHGALLPGDIALVRTGWGKRWPDRRQYMGTDKAGDVEGLRFPGISREAAQLLAGRPVSGVGIDTASLDHGRSRDFMTHRILNGANIYGLENVANLDRVPESGATLIALPVKVKSGTGGPVRIVAIVP